MRNRLLLRFRSLSNMNMSRRRNLCVWAGSLVLAVVVLFPPWMAARHTSYQVPDQRVLGVSPLWSPPGSPGRGYLVSIDVPVLALEVIALEAIIFALYATWAKQ